MGQLTALGFPTVEAQVPGGVLRLRGLSLDDVMRLARTYTKTLPVLFAKFVSEETPDLDDLGAIAALLAETAPEVAADIIAMAADDPGASNVAKRLPFPVQVDLLDKIGSVTFTSELPPKKLGELVLRMVAGLSRLTRDLQPSPSGLEGTAGK